MSLFKHKKSDFKIDIFYINVFFKKQIKFVYLFLIISRKLFFFKRNNLDKKKTKNYLFY